MINIVLVEPEIPMNTGNVARTCAATGSRLHLIRPLGFDISEKAVRRAGLDYWHLVDLRLTTTRAVRRYSDADYRDGCWLFFGKETAGLPLSLLERWPDRCVRLPMRKEARSLNLANTVAAVTYEALRQLDFPGLSWDGAAAWRDQKSSAVRR